MLPLLDAMPHATLRACCRLLRYYDCLRLYGYASLRYCFTPYADFDMFRADTLRCLLFRRYFHFLPYDASLCFRYYYVTPLLIFDADSYYAMIRHGASCLMLLLFSLFIAASAIADRPLLLRCCFRALPLDDIFR